MKNTACITMLLLLFIAIFAFTALAQEQPKNQTIDVIGTGRIQRGDISGARDQAISDCLITAISLVTTDLLQQQVFIQSFQNINRLLFSGADNFVQDYKVLTEDTTGRVYRVMVQATVSVDKIRELLIQNEILSQNAGPLRVLLLIAEQDLDDLFYRYWWGNAQFDVVSEAPLANALVEQGFVVADHNPLWSLADNFDILMETPFGPEMSNSQAVALGIRFQADVVVVGTAKVKKAPNVLGDELKSFEGGLSVRALRVDTEAVLAEINHKFITADADDLAGSRRALAEAGVQTGELLAWKIQTAWQQTLNKGPTPATIVVEGNFQLSHLVAFRRILSGMQGVSDLQTTKMTPKETILSLDYDGTNKELAEALLLNSFEGFGVHITEATPEAIRLSLVSN